MYRNLALGLGLFLAMVVGGFLGPVVLVLSLPAVNPTKPSAVVVAASVVAGTIIGGIAWKCWEKWNSPPRKPSN